MFPQKHFTLPLGEISYATVGAMIRVPPALAVDGCWLVDYYAGDRAQSPALDLFNFTAGPSRSKKAELSQLPLNVLNLESAVDRVAPF